VARPLVCLANALCFSLHNLINGIVRPDALFSQLRPVEHNADRGAEHREAFRLITWGKTMESLQWRGAERFKRDIPSAELHLLDTGHFALEDELDRIGSLMHQFLDRTINKKIQPVFEAA
jgi:hypothetical protein